MGRGDAPARVDGGQGHREWGEKKVPAMTRGLLGAVLAAALVAGCGGGAATTPTVPSVHTVTGSLVLSGDGAVNITFPTCAGAGGYDDIHSGASLTVLNEASTIIGTTSLAAGTWANRTDKLAGLAGCWFDFTIPSVPEATFYTVKIGSRAGPSWSRADMETQSWKISLTLGK
jgi:hypothetical protein